jgi:mRNA interferase MazF
VSIPIDRGAVLWLDLDPTKGREQAGVRPGLVISSTGYLANVPELIIVVPITTTNRSWPHHVQLTGNRLELAKPSFAMTEQPRTVARSRVVGHAGFVDDVCLASVSRWLRDFTGL